MRSTERYLPPKPEDGGSDDAATKAELLARFRGPVEENDAERVAFWARASDADHARAMIELARYAEMMAARTGYRKDFDDMFPGFPDNRTDSHGGRDGH